MGTCATRLLVTAAAAVAGGAVYAQAELPPATTDLERQLVERIIELRAEGGPAAAGAIEPLRALGVQYQENGNHAFAIVALEEARHVTRVQQGLSTVDEALLIRQQIRSEEALGNLTGVWDLEQDMLTIARQNHDDPRTVPIFRDLADDRSDALRRYRSGDMPPEIHLGCYYSAPPTPYEDTRGERRPPVGSEGGCLAGSKRVVLHQLRSEILLYYADAIEVLVKNGDFANPALRELEKQALSLARFPRFSALCATQRFSELVALPLLGSCLQPVDRSTFGGTANVGGWVSLVRLIAYEVRSGAPAAVRGNAVAELADWHVLGASADGRSLHRANETALGLYELAYRELQRGADARESTARIFSPELPVTLPTSEPNPLVTAATAQSARYIDVAFAVTHNGNGERIEILDTGSGATRAEERELIRLIETTTFRPRVVDGEVAAAAPVTLRYRLGAGDQ